MSTQHTPAQRSVPEKSSFGRMAVRWYVLMLPPGHRGNPARHLDKELLRRKRNGEESFEYFAPVFINFAPGSTTNRPQPLFYNYVFVHASEHEILRIKQHAPMFNFMRRVADSGRGHFPYVTDEDMDNLRLLAEAYSGRIPAYTPDAGMLRKGDRVRIVGGRFDGIVATLLRRPAGASGELAVCIDNWLWVPVLHLAPGRYEIIELHAERKNLYSVLGNEHIMSGLRTALLASLTPDGPTPDQRRLACETAMRYGNLEIPTRVLRGKHLAMMLLAYAVSGDRARLKAAEREAAELLRHPFPEFTRALLLVSLYGTTRSHSDEAFAATAPWREEKNTKKNKRDLIAWLDAIDSALNQEQ